MTPTAIPFKREIAPTVTHRLRPGQRWPYTGPKPRGVLMKSGFKVDLLRAAEAEAPAGLSRTLQRNHRLKFPQWHPKYGKHDRFDLLRCLLMRFVADAGEFGIGPAKAYPIGEWVAHHALYYALNQPGCIIGDLAADYSAPDPSAEEIKEYTVRRVFAEAFGRPCITPVPFAVIWGDGTDWFGQSLDDCLNSIPADDERIEKPLLAVHLPSFARKVVRKLPRPAVQIIREDG